MEINELIRRYNGVRDKKLTLEDLAKKRPGLEKFIQDNHCNYGENTPVPNRFLRKLPGNKVIIPKEVFIKLMEMAKRTRETDCEHTFLLVAKPNNVKGNTCKITDFFESNSEVQGRRTQYDAKTIEYLNKLADDVRNGTTSEGGVVFCGHTHPAKGKWYDCFSFGDISNSINKIRGNDIYTRRKIETASCMLTADGKIRMLFYDPERDDFYLFSDIVVELQTGERDFEDASECWITGKDRKKGTRDDR